MASSSTTGIKQEPSWDWSGVDSELRRRPGAAGSGIPGAFEDTQPVKQEPTIKQEYAQPSVKTEPDDEGPPASFYDSPEYNGDAEPEPAPAPEPTPRTWPSRTCRICLEVVPPTLHTFDALPGFLQRKPRVTYVSEDAELGRLIRPCKCKGSSRYVHEGCLQQWRHSDNSFRARNYFYCPTCGYKYHLSRMTWARLIKSTALQIALTLAIFIGTIFVLGFVADPIINFYLDPVDTLAGSLLDGEPIFSGERADDDGGWVEHFLKGVASLGLLGFIKMFFSMSAWTQWSFRNSGAFSSGRRAGQTGRERLGTFTWIVILTGVVTFLWTVWKGVRAWSRKTLEQASDKVMDVPMDDDEEVLVDVDSAPPAPSSRLITNAT